MSTASARTGVYGSSGRKLKRRKTTGSPPVISNRLCVGTHALPYEIMDIVGKPCLLVPVCALQKVEPWVVYEFGWAVMPNDCVITEIRDAINASRKSRSRFLWKGKDANRVITTEVRGEAVKLSNEKIGVKLVVEPAEDPVTQQVTYPILTWFVNELYDDLHPIFSDGSDSNQSDVCSECDIGSDDNGDAFDMEEDVVKREDEPGEDSEPKECDASVCSDNAASHRSDDVFLRNIKLAKKPGHRFFWAPSKNAFIVQDSKRKVVTVPKAKMKDLTSSVKWINATRRAVIDHINTGNDISVTEADLWDTDEELSHTPIYEHCPSTPTLSRSWSSLSGQPSVDGPSVNTTHATQPHIGSSSNGLPMPPET